MRFRPVLIRLLVAALLVVAIRVYTTWERTPEGDDSAAAITQVSLSPGGQGDAASPGRESGALSGAGQSDAAPGSALATGIDSVQLFTHLAVLAADSMEGRAAGSEGGARARRYLVGVLEQMDLAPLGAGYEHPFAWSGGEGINLLAHIRGSEHPDRVIVLSAHYDHVGIRGGDIHNGADDNASGVSTVLAIARVLRDVPPRTSVVIALLDAEENGLQGARAFVADPPVPIETIDLNVNLDMVSRTAGLLWAAGSHHTPALRPVLEPVAETAPLTLRLGHDRPQALEGDDWTNSSDHGPFHAAGVPFVYFGVEDHADYHAATDDFHRVVPAEFMASARTILSAVRALDAALPIPGR